MFIETLGVRVKSRTSFRILILFMSLILLAASSATAAPPEALVLRRMDPSLGLMYRAAKGKGAIGLAHAREIHERLHPKRGKGRAGAKPVDPRLELLVRYSGPAADLEAVGFVVQAKVGEIFTGTLPVDRLVELAELSRVRFLQGATELSAHSSSSNDDAPNRPSAHAAWPARPAQSLTAAPQSGGSNVLIGFIDTGVDVFHDDFRKGDGSTRIKYLLDLSDPGDVDHDGDLDGAGPYGGTLYTEAEINTALGVGTFAEADTTGHGTHGLSVAAGDDATLPGMAPSADLIVVKATRDDGTLSFTSTDIINALAFVDEKAGELGMPYVANLSLGTMFSSHDGRSLEEQAIDALVGPGKPGKAVVVAAGNSSDNRGSLKRHWSGTAYVGIPTAQTFTVPAYTANAGKGNDRIVLDLWYEGNDKLTVKVTSPNGHIVTAVNGDYADQQTPDGDVFIANLGGANPENGDVEAIVLIDDWTGPAPKDGTWTVTLEGTEIGATGEFHGWLAEDSVVGSSSPALGGGADNLLLVGKPGGAYNAVTVGSYATHEPGTRFLTNWTDVNAIGRTDTSAVNGDISDFSSPGNTRDGRVKPEVTAPGERVMGAVSRDALPGVSPTSIYIYHPFAEPDALLTDDTANHAFGMLQGTSFAAPVVTGLVARILEADPTLDAVQVRNILVNSAATDGFTGVVPNEYWGYGKVDRTVASGGALPNDLRIVPDTLPAGVRARQYNFVLTASGGTLPYSWFVTGGSLPPGLTLENGGFLTGKPTTAGSYALTIQVSDSSSVTKTATKGFTIEIANAANLHITSTAHPVAHLDKPYKTKANAEGGTPGYAWTLAGGALPPGLTLDGDGEISGTPALAGTYSFTLQVEDAVSATNLKSVKIRVRGEAGSDWSVLGRSTPSVTEIAADPNDPTRLVAATTNIDAIFLSGDSGNSWTPISINNGLNTSGVNLLFNELTSEPWIVRKFHDGTYYVYVAMVFGGSSWLELGGVSEKGPSAITSSDTGTMYGVGIQQTFVMSSTDRQSWTSVSGDFNNCGGLFFPVRPSTASITFASPSIAYIVRAGTHAPSWAPALGICGSTDGGATWASIVNGSSGDRDIQASSIDPLDVLKAGPTFVDRSLDGGRNWVRVNLQPAGSTIQMRRARSAPWIVLAGTDQGLFKSMDGGASWSRIPTLGGHVDITAVAIDPVDSDVFYVGSAVGVQRSMDGGLTWSNASTGLIRRVMGDVKTSSALPWEVAVASADGPYLSRTSGDGWTKSTPGMSTPSTRKVAISAADPSLFFAGTEDAVYRSTNGGVTWTRVDGGVATGYPVVALEADPFDTNYALFSLSGTRGTYRSTDGGLTFSSANVGLPYGTPNDMSFATDPAHPGRVFVALTTDGLYRSEDRGATWSAFGLNTQTARAVESAPTDGDYVYAAGATQMYFLDPSVGTWQVATVGPVNPVLCIAVDAKEKLVAYAGADHPGTAGNTGGVYKTTDGGHNWTRLAGVLDQLDVVALAAHPTTSGIVWAATLNGGVFRTDDGGLTWKELANYGTVADLTNVNVPDPSNPFLLFAGTEGYGVQASTDGGKTFVPKVTGLGNLYVNAVAFDPDAPTTLYAATDSGVYKSTDSGNNWTATPLMTGEVADLVTDNEGAGKRIWATVAGEGVAYSPDAGATFTTYSSGLASLQLTSLEIESRGAGKRIWATTHGGDGVAFSDDLGQTWVSSAGNGLTDRDVNDLAIQSGTGKRIWATTNSGVYMSDDDGLSWRDLSIGLPSGIPATSVTVDPNSGETLVSLFSDDGGGVYRGGGVNGYWREFSTGLEELKVRKLTRTGGYTIDSNTLGARFYAATAGDGVYSTELSTNVEGAPVITTYNLPRALLRASYTAMLEATGGTPPYTWSVQEGDLPPGLGLDESTGEIAGEPGVSGIYRIEVQVADANQRTARKELTIEVVSGDELQVTQCVPGLGVRGATLDVTVKGSSFEDTPTVSFGDGVTVNGVTFVSASELTVNVSIDGGATPGYRTVTVTNPSTASASLTDGFKVEYPTPTVTSADPALGSRKATLDVVVTGTNFENGASVSFGDGVTVNSVTPGSSTSLTANVTITSGAALGVRDVTVTNVNGFFGTLSSGFTVRAAKPTLSSISPTQGNQGATFVVTLTGNDFQSGATSSFGTGITVNSTSFVSATQLTANITIAAGATLGSRTVTVTNPDGQTGSLASALLVKGPTPQLLSTSPSQGTLGQTLDVTLGGTGFQAGAAVSFGLGVTVNSVTVNSSTQITANVTVSPSATPGFRTVTVTNLDAQVATKANAFEVRALPPVLSSLDPAEGARARTIAVNLVGSAFLAGATVSFGSNITVNSLTVLSPTLASANITIGETAALGARSVTFTNPDSQASTLASSFTVRDFAPEVVSVTPVILGPCNSGPVVVKGYHFVTGATVSFGPGVTVSGTVVDSASRITATVSVATGAAQGARTVTVTNPDGQSGSSTSAFQVAGPTYSSSSATYAWVDAAGGTDAGVSGDDVEATIPIGFTFPFYGTPYTTVTVSSNGYLTLGGPGVAFDNTAIPAAGAPNNLIAVFWDDLDLGTPPASVTYEVQGSEPNRTLVVQWSSARSIMSPETGSFQAILSEADGSILLQYQDVTFGDPLHDGGASATIGIENATGTAGVQVAHNSAVVSAATAYLLSIDTPSCEAFPLSITFGGVGTGRVTSFPSGIDCGADCSADFQDGTTVTLSATADAGSIFTGWSGACDGVGACRSTLDQAKSVVAAFTRDCGEATPVVDIHASASTTFCEGESVTLTASVEPGAGVSYLWSPGGETTRSIDVTQSGSYTVRVTVGECIGASSTMVVTATSKPEPPVAGNDGPYCEGATVSLTAKTVSGATYEWTGPGGFTSSSQNPTIPNATVADAGTYSLTVTVNGCSSPVSTTSVVVSGPPAAPVIMAPASVMPETSGATASVVSHDGSTWQWTITNGTIDSGQSTSEISFTSGASGKIELSVIETTAGGCVSGTGMKVVPIASPPTISIDDATVTEGHSGTTNAQFTVSLSKVSGQTVTVQYATADGTATAGSDYVAASGTVNLDPGETSKTVVVQVIGDTAQEGNESFVVNLSSPTNATIVDGQGVGTITDDDTFVPGVAPTGVTATAVIATSVGVNWNPVPGATGYKVYRRGPGSGYALVGAPAGTAFTDPTASAGTAYLYRVRATNGTTDSVDSNPDLATTVIFTDPTITAGVTKAKTAHVTELRTAVNAVRALAGLSSASFTDPTLTNAIFVKQLHVTELRTALDAARSALGLPAMSYTDPTITAGVTRVKAAHITELRSGVR